MDIEVGKRCRIIEEYEGGTVVTHKGTVMDVTDSTVDFGGGHTAWRHSRDGVEVTVEELHDPLPTTPGSVIEHSELEHLMLGESDGEPVWWDGAGDWWLPESVAEHPGTWTVRYVPEAAS